MVEYIKTKKGYFYKLLKNGEKKRISREEYNKKIKQGKNKTMKNKTIKNKTRKNKKMIGGAEPDTILEEDILYEDDMVRILKPDVKKGILVFAYYTPAADGTHINQSGFEKTRIKQPGENYNPQYIIFNAPYYYSDSIDYTSVDAEIKSSYKQDLDNDNEMLQGVQKPKVFIRVDPNKTKVFSKILRKRNVPPARQSRSGRIPSSATGQIRAHPGRYAPLTGYVSRVHTPAQPLQANRPNRPNPQDHSKLLNEYLDIIKENKQIIENIKAHEPGAMIVYSYITGVAGKARNNAPDQSYLETEKSSEIYVKTDLTPDHFVKTI